MKEDYPFDSILINHREVFLRDILDESAKAKTDFEQDTFSFLLAWINQMPFYELETSGSTGARKKIKFSRSQLIQSAQCTIKTLSLCAGTNALVCLNTKFVAGKMMLVRAWVNHMKIIAVEPSAHPFSGLSPDLEIELVAFVPLQMEALLDHKEGLLPSIKHILIGGARVHESLADRISGIRDTQVWATFGMTETLSHIALMALHTGQKTFKALEGVTLSTDDRGCLRIYAPFLNEPVNTNDLVTLVAEDTFFWRGRMDHVINSGGIKVIPEEVEEKVSAVFFRLNIKNPYFIGSEPDSRLGEKIILFVEGVLSDSLHKALNASLQAENLGYTTPKDIKVLKRFKWTKTQKIDRRGTLQLVQKWQ